MVAATPIRMPYLAAVISAGAAVDDAAGKRRRDPHGNAGERYRRDRAGVGDAAGERRYQADESSWPTTMPTTMPLCSP